MSTLICMSLRIANLYKYGSKELNIDFGRNLLLCAWLVSKQADVREF